MSVTTPALGHFRNSEFIRYLKNTVTTCLNHNAAALQPQVNALQAAITPMDELFMADRNNLITEELQGLDARRDAALNGIRITAGGYAYHFDPVIKQAAHVLIAGIDKYGTGIARYNYIAETEVISSLADDFAKDAAMAAALQTLQWESWAAEMKSANEAFNQRYLDRTNDYAEKPQGSLTELRGEAAKQYEVLVAHLTAHYTLTPSEAYGKLIGALNSLTDQYNRVINNRAGGNGEPDDVPPADSETDAGMQE